MLHLKPPGLAPEEADRRVRSSVESMLEAIAQRGETAIREMQIDEPANEVFSAVASRISRIEDMAGHARACDWRRRNYFPERQRDFEVYDRVKY